jgi:CBS domain containing-hemolysin-like protein
VTELLIPVSIILGLVIANGLFVAAEFAIVGAPRASVEHLAGQGSRLAQRVLRVLEDPKLKDRYIATTQIGISVASLGLGMYGEHWLAERLAGWIEPIGTGGWIAVHTLASIIAIAILTYLHIVIGEMVPKALALQRAQRTALIVSPIIRLLERILFPLVVGLNAIGNAILGLIGIRRQEVDAERYHSAEELQLIVQESQAGGMLRGESGKILRELFAFSDLNAGEIMVPRVLLTGIPVGAEPDELRAIVRAQPFTRYPVYAGDPDHIVGSLHIKQVLRHLLSNQTVTERDARPVPYIPGPTTLEEVHNAMRRFSAQMAVVMDQHGGTAGLVTMDDLFEVIVGEIEEGPGQTTIVKESDSRLRVPGTMRLKEAGEAIGLPIEHPKVTTVSGLVLVLLGRPAKVGDAVAWGGVLFEVTAVAGRGVREAVLSVVGVP